jgi:hypothetical protein
MAINYSWVISQLECKIQEGDLQEVVYTIHYRRQATEVDGDKTYLAETYSTVSVPAPDPSDFTPYEDLTKAQVEGWLDELLPVSDIDASLDAQIELQKNPTTNTPALPWSENSNQ